jgi:hypothetical protein
MATNIWPNVKKKVIVKKGTNNLDFYNLPVANEEAVM